MTDEPKQPDPITERVAEKIAAAAPDIPPGHVFIPTPGLAVRLPPQQDPSKKNGSMAIMPWMLAIGIYAIGKGAAGLVTFGVLVIVDKTQQYIQHTPELEWSQITAPAVPAAPIPMYPNPN